jgi:lysophospholipid acyltransferase (LPLAT)-like uncharacterized protein
VGERSWYIAGRTAGLVLRLWRTTIRVENRNSGVRKPPYVVAAWHGRVIPSMMDNYDCRGVTMASRSTTARCGRHRSPARGGRHRGSTCARAWTPEEMEEIVRSGGLLRRLTPDGPAARGGRSRRASNLARRLQVPLIPITSSCRLAWVLRSWDHMVLPKPFTRVVVAYGEPWSPERLAGPLPAVLAGVAADLNALTASLDREVAGRELWPPT